MKHMIKAMIIDDEKLIREGLVTYIDWAALGVEVCAVCGDCAGAVRAAALHRPQIILADICLPDASGLELFRQIRDCGLKCEAIFISSYSEFQYAQQAVKLGAFDYLLKPIEADVLYDCVRRCAEKIRSTKDPGGQNCDRTVVEKILTDALTNVPQADQTFLHLARLAGAPEGSRPFLLVSVTGEAPVVGLSPGIGLSPGAGAPAGFDLPVLAAYQARVSDQVACCCFFTVPELEQTALNTLEKALTGSTDLSVRLCLDEPDASLYALLQQALCGLLLTRLPAPGSRILFDPAQQNLVPEVIKSLDQASLKTALSQFLRFCRENRWTCKHLDFQFECFKFLETIYKQLTWVYGLPLPAGLDMHVFIERLRKPNNLYDLFTALDQILTMVFTEVRRDSCQSPYTKKTLAIIRSRYGESLSLKSVARELHVSPSYLSSVFKDDTGCPFSDYLFLHRMNIAYDLVRQGSLRIYEIGEQVGYPDVAQFSKCFKKQFGYSPKQLQNASGRLEP